MSNLYLIWTSHLGMRGCALTVVWLPCLAVSQCCVFCFMLNYWTGHLGMRGWSLTVVSGFRALHIANVVLSVLSVLSAFLLRGFLF